MKHDNYNNKYILDNVLNGVIPFCFFNEKEFSYYNRFDRNLKVSFFENYFKYNLPSLKILKNNFIFIAICSNNGVLKVFTLHCRNNYFHDRYINTSILLFENISEFNFINEITPNYERKEIDIDNVDFNSRGWETLWLYSLGLTRKQISEMLNVSYENINKRLMRAKKQFGNYSLDELRFYIKDSGVFFNNIPKKFDTHKLIRIS